MRHFVTPNDTINRWGNEDVFFDDFDEVPFISSGNGGKFRVYIDAESRQDASYYVGIKNCPQTMTGNVCDRPPLLSDDAGDNPNLVFDTSTFKHTGLIDVYPACECGNSTFRDLVPNGENYPSVGDWDIPYDGRHYYGLVNVNSSDWRTAQRVINNVTYTYYVYPVTFEMDSTVKPGDYMIHVQSAVSDIGHFDWAEGEVSIKYGNIDLTYQKYVNGKYEAIDSSANLTETVYIDGANTDTQNTYLWLAGPGLPPCGINLLAKSVSDGSPYVVKSDNNGRFHSVITWDSSTLPVESGKYEIVASSVKPDEYYKDCEKCGVCPDKGKCGLENCPICGIYDYFDFTFLEPDFTGTIVPTDVERCCCDGNPCGVMGGVESIILSGSSKANADKGNKKLQLWMFGDGLVGDEKYLFDYLPVDCDGNFKIDLNNDFIRKNNMSLCSLAAGTYTVIVQTPWLNQEFDVLIDEYAVGGVNDLVPNRPYVVSSSPIKWAHQFQIDGAGATIGSEALDGLIDAFDDPNVDDKYLKLSFTVKDSVDGGIDFEATPVKGNSPLNVQFTDTSSFEAVSWDWDFGDGSTSTEQNPEHTYKEAGHYTVTLSVSDGASTKTLAKNAMIKVLEGPVPDFTVTPDAGLVPLTVQFTDTSIGTPSTWAWDFGDGEKSPLQSPEHTYEQAGEYDVTLTVSNAIGENSITKSGAVRVSNELPQAAFTFTPESSKVYPATISFSDASLGEGIVSWVWWFGDGIDPGSYSTEKNPVHEYKMSGLYPVELTVTNDAGESSAYGTVEIGDHQSAGVIDFKADVVEGNSPLKVQFCSSSTFEADSWEWNFGDGETSTEINPEHTYETGGLYSVTLKGTNAYETKEKTRPDYILVFDAPAADFTISPNAGEPPLSVQFTDTSTGWPSSWAWDFGDGTKSPLQSPDHTYEQAGDYTVTLTVSNEFGTNSKKIVDAVSVHNGLPTADFSYSPEYSESYPASFRFYNESTGENIDAIEWLILDVAGEQIFYSEDNPVHEFEFPGVYIVDLFVENDAGYSVAEEMLIVGNNYTGAVDFTSDLNQGNVPLDVTFTYTGDFEATSFNWDFGDGEKSTEQNPVHTYESVGNYDVTLTASNDEESKFTVKKAFIKVGADLVADFSFAPASVYANEEIHFSDQSSDTPTSWMWKFGDGTTSSLQSPVHSYLTPGNYEVTLTVSNIHGIGIPAEKQVLVMNEAPKAAFSASPITSTSAPATVYFVDASSGDEITSWLWEFGDGSTSSDKNPIHTYMKPGLFTVSLTVKNNGGESCETKTDYISVGTEPGVGNVIELNPKKNLFSVPAILNSGHSTVSEVFDGVNRGGQPVKKYDTDTNEWIALDEDTVLEPLNAYKVYLNDNKKVKVTLYYNEGGLDLSRSLDAGWETIGILGPSPKSANDALVSLGDKWDKVIGFDSSLQEWTDPIIRGENDYELLTLTKGYMIYMNDSGIFEQKW